MRLSYFFLVLLSSISLVYAQDDIEKAFATTRFSCDYTFHSLKEIINDLEKKKPEKATFPSGIKFNIVADSKLERIYRINDGKMSFQLKDVLFKDALAILLGFYNLSYVVNGSVIFISSNEVDSTREKSVVWYDINYILPHLNSFHFPYKNLDRIWVPTTNDKEIKTHQIYSATILKNLITKLIYPISWKEAGSSIDIFKNYLIISQVKQVHSRIKVFLDSLVEPPLTIAIDLETFEIRNEFLSQVIKNYDKPIIDKEALGVLENLPKNLISKFSIRDYNNNIVSVSDCKENNIGSNYTIRPMILSSNEVLIDFVAAIAQPYKGEDKANFTFQNISTSFILPIEQKNIICVSPFSLDSSVITIMSASFDKMESIEEKDKIDPLEDKKLADFDFDHQTLKQSIDLLREKTNLNIIIDPNIYTHLNSTYPYITASINDVEAIKALDIILAKQGLSRALYRGIHIVTARDYSGETEIMVYDMNSAFSVSTNEILKNGFPNYKEEFYSLVSLIEHDTWSISDRKMGFWNDKLIIAQSQSIHTKLQGYLKSISEKVKDHHKAVVFWSYLESENKEIESFSLIRGRNLQKMYSGSGIFYLLDPNKYYQTFLQIEPQIINKNVHVKMNLEKIGGSVSDNQTQFILPVNSNMNIGNTLLDGTIYNLYTGVYSDMEN